MTGPELYEFIKNDPELMEQIRQGLIQNQVLHPRGGRKPNPRNRATREFLRFWDSRQGTVFRLKLERKLDPVLAVRMMRGREARIRTVMTLIVDDVLRELESQEA